MFLCTYCGLKFLFYTFQIIVFRFLIVFFFYFFVLLGLLVTNPISDLDKAVNTLRMKYRTYIVEYDVEEVGS